MDETIALFMADVAAGVAWTALMVEAERNGENFEFTDNFRCARVGNASEEAAFEEAAAHGCCGSFGGEVTGENGQVWRVGFNYGH